jgi:hypothetical protein
MAAFSRRTASASRMAMITRSTAVLAACLGCPPSTSRAMMLSRSSSAA